MRHPEILWAQRTDKVYLTVELPDTNNPEVQLKPEGKFIFSATAGGSENYDLYECELDLFDKVIVEESKINIGPRHIFIIIQKGEKKWWNRLLESEGKPPPYIKVDWNKWIDEDEDMGTSK